MDRDYIELVRQIEIQKAEIERLKTLESPRLNSVINDFLLIPGLRGFWPMSAVDYTNPQARDIAGGYHLTNNNTATFGYDPTSVLAPCVFLDGVNQYLSRADGGAANWADITGTETYIENTIVGARGLTLGGWFYITRTNAFEYLMTKATLPNDIAYYLRHDNGGTFRAVVTTDGSTVIGQTSTNAPTANQWVFAAMKFDPSASLTVYVNETSDPLAAGIPASIFDSTTQFQIGAVNAVSSTFFAGRASLCFLCAAKLDDDLIEYLYQRSKTLFI